MAKIVSTKFGDRRLVYLPPISLKGTKTPNVETIETSRQVPERYRNTGAVSVVPKEYAYTKQPADTKNAWLGAPVRSTLEGNIVTEYPKQMGDQIFQQLYQQASTDTMANYGQGQYPVLPPIGETSPQMQYTNYGLQNMAQQQPFTNNQVAQPGPVQQQNQGSNQNEKHIYYGPNGEVLPGPPHPSCHGSCRETPQDFAIEGVLNFGRLKEITLIENASGFPKLPDYLIKDLLEKYGQYEQTVVRVVARLGRCYVNATPLVRQNPRFQPPVKPKYVPVYLNEDEDFDYDRFISDYENGYNLSPNHLGGYRFRRRHPWSPPSSRKLVHNFDPFRPQTYDTAENFRWHKTNDRYTGIGRRTAPSSRAEISEYKFGRRMGLETRDDIKPIEKLDRYYRK